MKPHFYLILLFIAISITGCSSSDDPVNENAPVAEFEIFGELKQVEVESAIYRENNNVFGISGFFAGNSNPFFLRLEMYVDPENPPRETTFVANNSLEVNTFNSDSSFSYTVPCTTNDIEGETCGSIGGSLTSGTIVVTFLEENTYKMILDVETDEGHQLKGKVIQTFNIE
ncbi:hypothetical protein [Abyssalbus ytuae]|uniref:Lipoprotein n=1 Tax=Abyssalbus ytuae TaxID=2926907 RepID=A0A9E7A0K3_9FLAO|nr:hypothetical protein [Abyssalbus ytuae]UOB17481.1 hypothetical protein MQE35_17310 [Abyssalbus ytuae]